MRRENWEQVKDIFNRALEIPTGEREGFLSKHCAGDESLRRDVEILIASFDASESFLQIPAVGSVAELLAGSTEKLKAGQTVNQYKILRFLGAGGMGEVYLAKDTKLNRRVALKILSSDLVNANGHKRFLREAQTAAALDHPNICGIFEIGESDGQVFIVMQYVEGETLCEKLKQGNLSLSEKVGIGVQMAEALAEAHAHKIAHRDIKPANLILTPRGQLKVLDFGLAKIVSENDPQQLQITSSNAGMVLGTVSYMSPEQVRGQKVDGRTDVWSLGVVLYEMLTGELPFSGETASDKIAGILKTDPPPLKNVPGSLVSIVSKALSKDYQTRCTAEEILADLRSVQKRLETNSARPTASIFSAQNQTIIIKTRPQTSLLSVLNISKKPFEIKSMSPRRIFPVFGVLSMTLLSLICFHFFLNLKILKPAGFVQTTNAAVRWRNFSHRNVAVLGFKDLSNRSSDKARLSFALEEMLSTELGIDGRLRIIPPETIARAKRQFEHSGALNLTPEALAKISSDLNAEFIISGSFMVLNDSRGEKIRLDIRVLDLMNGETVASIAESGTKAELFELISRIGARLREVIDTEFLNPKKFSAYSFASKGRSGAPISRRA